MCPGASWVGGGVVGQWVIFGGRRMDGLGYGGQRCPGVVTHSLFLFLLLSHWWLSLSFCLRAVSWSLVLSFALSGRPLPGERWPGVGLFVPASPGVPELLFAGEGPQLLVPCGHFQRPPRAQDSLGRVCVCGGVPGFGGVLFCF